MVEDASQGIAFVCKNIASYGGDPSRFITYPCVDICLLPQNWNSSYLFFSKIFIFLKKRSVQGKLNEKVQTSVLRWHIQSTSVLTYAGYILLDNQLVHILLLVLS